MASIGDECSAILRSDKIKSDPHRLVVSYQMLQIQANVSNSLVNLVTVRELILVSPLGEKLHPNSLTVRRNDENQHWETSPYHFAIRLSDLGQ